MPRKKTNHPLRLWLRLADKTPSEFARELGVSRGYITHIVHGRRKPTKLLKKIAAKTGLSFDVLQSWAA